MPCGGVYSAMIVGRPGSSASPRRRARTAIPPAPTTASPAIACTQPIGAARYDESKTANVSGSNPTAIVRV